MVGICLCSLLRRVARFLVNYVRYGGRRKKRFLLPIWEKRSFKRRDPTKINSINLIKAFNTSILSI